jgi:hypothetical protein
VPIEVCETIAQKAAEPVFAIFFHEKVPKHLGYFCDSEINARRKQFYFRRKFAKSGHPVWVG